MKALEQIEADVIIVLTNGNNGAVYPLWECDSRPQELTQQAITAALKLSEDLGGGVTEYEIHDFRDNEED